jgi:hypothetical protein
MTDDFLTRCFDRDPEKLRAMFAKATVLGADRMDSEDVGTLAEMRPFEPVHRGAGRAGPG